METQKHYAENTYDIVTKMAYLLGIPSDIIKKESRCYNMDIYHELEENIAARRIRHLSVLRSYLMRKTGLLKQKFIYEFKNLDTVDDALIPQESVQAVIESGIDIVHSGWQPSKYIIFVCNEIKCRISECKDLFPYWIDWTYIKDLFISPTLNTNNDVSNLIKVYRENYAAYPFNMYVRRVPENLGNILVNDRRFVIDYLYPIHGATFDQKSKVTTASLETTGNIKEFLQESEHTVLVVDCENSDPYKLYSTLQNMQESEIAKISKIIMYNDARTSSAWQQLKHFIHNIDEKMTPRVKNDKSLVDMSLAVGVCKAHYEEGISSFILVSSDSDYWGLIRQMPDCRFMVLLEKEKTSAAIKSILKEHEILYADINDFCSADLQKLQEQAMVSEIRKSLEVYQMDFNAIMDEAIENTRMELSDNEKERFLSDLLKKLHVHIDITNKVCIAI